MVIWIFCPLKKVRQFILASVPGLVAQSIMCLAADRCLTADPGIAGLIPARFYTFVVIDHEIISTVILLPADSRRLVVSYKQMYVHEVLVNC